MKKIVTIVTAALVSVAALAQISVGGGYLQSTSTYQAKAGGDVHSSAANGFYVGAGYEMELMKGITLTPGVYYSYLTSNDASSGSIGGIVSGSTKTKLTEQYLNVPVMVNLGYNLNRDLRLFAFGGPTISLGLSSKSHYDSNVSIVGINLGDSGDIDNYAGSNGNASTYSRFDVLLGAGAGVDIKDKIRVTVGYDWGMLNRNTDANSTGIQHRNQLKAGVALLF
jgi:hypothetical protein